MIHCSQFIHLTRIYLRRTCRLLVRGKRIAIGVLFVLSFVIILLDWIPDPKPEQKTLPQVVHRVKPRRNLTTNTQKNIQDSRERDLEYERNIFANMTRVEVVRHVRESAMILPRAYHWTMRRKLMRRGESFTFTNPKDSSRDGVSKIVDELLDFRRFGFFIEAGAGNGMGFSETLLFENDRQWTGLLIEPDKDLFNSMRVNSGREVAMLNACLSPTVNAGKFSFVGDVDWDGVLKYRLERYIPWVTPIEDQQNVPHEGFDVLVPCVPLTSAILALRVMRIDYLALDAGDAEVDILSTAALDTFIYDVITVNVWAGNVKSTLVKIESVKDKLKDFNYMFVAVLPRNWMQMERATLILQQVPILYPMKPNRVKTIELGSKPQPNNTDALSPAEFIATWMHQPVHFLNTPENSLPKHTFRAEYFKALRYIIGNSSNGFFIEANARDGKLTSPSLLLEEQLQWSGVLLEPDQDLFQKLHRRGRQCFSLNACITLEEQNKRKLFKPNYSLSPLSRILTRDDEQKGLCGDSVNQTVYVGVGELRCVQCVSVNTIEKGLNQNYVDFLSLHLVDLFEEPLRNLVKYGVDVLAVEYPLPLSELELDLAPQINELSSDLEKVGYYLAGHTKDRVHLLSATMFFKYRSPTTPHNQTTSPAP